MNVSFTMVKKSVIIEEGILKIYHAGFVENQKDYDAVVHATVSYITMEGFIDGDFITDTQVFDYKGNQILRKWCK